MNVNTSNLVSITEANQNFSKATKLADKMGSVTILRNNTPSYLLIPFSVVEKITYANDEDVMTLSKRLIAENMEAYKVLAK